MNKFDKKKNHLKMARQEANILHGLDHEGVCKLLDTFENEDHVYLMM